MQSRNKREGTYRNRRHWYQRKHGPNRKLRKVLSHGVWPARRTRLPSRKEQAMYDYSNNGGWYMFC